MHRPSSAGCHPGPRTSIRCRDPGGTRTGNRGTGAVLTGATGWIGLIVARSLGRDGPQTLLCAWDADAYAVSQLLREKGMDADGQTCEVRSTGQVDTVVHAAVDRYGPIDRRPRRQRRAQQRRPRRRAEGRAVARRRRHQPREPGGSRTSRSTARRRGPGHAGPTSRPVTSGSGSAGRPLSS
ncbi:SDR family NAD(P)-dependent oxidoreductase [Streptomyces celluloflavus]|uniref:SDR family NAD(P)-dependent oxidoreductase n=1 Tax=Streptomyces celluloflavus TaxID=58344 RepID=UPI0036A2E11C